MKPITLYKLVAQGNDFLLADARFTTAENWSELALVICSRHYGVGADGFLVLYSSPNALAGYQMFNPDGSEDFCVNGLACAACYLAIVGGIADQKFKVETVVGIRHMELSKNFGNVSDFLVTVDVGLPQFEPLQIPIDLPSCKPPIFNLPLQIEDHTVLINAVSTGVTHSVIFTSEPVSDEDFLLLSPAIECHKAFPKRTCVIWTQVIDAENISLRVWERGVGETLSCGSGICAAVAVSFAQNLTGRLVQVYTKGGSSKVFVDLDGSLRYIVCASLLFEFPQMHKYEEH